MRAKNISKFVIADSVEISIVFGLVKTLGMIKFTSLESIGYSGSISLRPSQSHAKIVEF